ncbi:BEL1-like homeodomain protein 9-like [Hibiscus syriacus]|uniref:BEL1-like homeodomain protein 9-like n=1 Tax=Hibiscus syriacus TaxID=106335 RepID=A0A6A2ZNG5_HIBSY|nr:BEL1-like homeodomain protein 9-like [Hibiscus syriacus]
MARGFGIINEEWCRAFWKGNMVTVAHRLPYSSVNFYAYERYKSRLQSTLGLENRRGHVRADPFVLFVGATFAIDLVRRRMQLQGAAGRACVHETGLLATFQHIIQSEGLCGLYRGVLPEYYKVVHGVGIVFMTYETLQMFLSSVRTDYWLHLELPVESNSSQAMIEGCRVWHEQGGPLDVIHSDITLQQVLGEVVSIRCMRVESNHGIYSQAGKISSHDEKAVKITIPSLSKVSMAIIGLGRTESTFHIREDRVICILRSRSTCLSTCCIWSLGCRLPLPHWQYKNLVTTKMIARESTYVAYLPRSKFLGIGFLFLLNISGSGVGLPYRGAIDIGQDKGTAFSPQRNSGAFGIDGKVASLSAIPLMDMKESFTKVTVRTYCKRKHSVNPITVVKGRMTNLS